MGSGICLAQGGEKELRLVSWTGRPGPLHLGGVAWIQTPSNTQSETEARQTAPATVPDWAFLSVEASMLLPVPRMPRPDKAESTKPALGSETAPWTLSDLLTGQERGRVGTVSIPPPSCSDSPS